MNKLIIPPSPNWFEANVVTCASDNTLIYGSTGDLVVIYPNNKDVAAKIQIIRNAHQRVVAVSTNYDWGKESKLVASIGDEKIVKLWNFNTLEEITSHRIHKVEEKSNSKLIGVAFATNDRIVSASSDGLIVLWQPSLNKTTLFKNLILVNSFVTCLATCPHATWLAAFGLGNGIIVVADLRKSGRVLHNLRCFDMSAIISLSWSPYPYNIFPENKRVILTLKPRANIKIAPLEIETPKLIDLVQEESVSKNIGEASSNDAEIIRPKINDFIDGEELIQAASVDLAKESGEPSSTSLSMESREQILTGLANLSLNQQGEQSKDEEPSTKNALESKNVKQNPWINLKYVDDDELNASSQNLDPRASLTPDKTAADEFDFLSECTALKYRILGERDIEESEDIDDEKLEKETVSEAVISETKSDESFEIIRSEKVQSAVLECQENVTSVVSVNGESSLEKNKLEYHLASSSKSGFIYIWRAGTDGSLQLELRTGKKLKHKRRIRRVIPVEQMWITILWITPNILLSTSPKGELLLWDLLKYAGNGSEHKSSIVHFNHRSPLFTISAKRIISIDTNDFLNDVSVWTTGQDKQIFETVLYSVWPCISSYLTLALVLCTSASPIDSNRIAMGQSDGSIVLWNLSVPHTRRISMNRYYLKNNAKITSLAWHPLAENIIGYGTSEGAVAIFSTTNNLDSYKFLSTFFKSPIHKVEWGPLKGQSDKYALYVCGEGKLVYYEVDDCKAAPVPIDIDVEYITHMSWKPDYSILAVGTKSNAIFLLSPSFKRYTAMFVAQKTITNMLWHPTATLYSTADVSKCCNWLAIATKAGQCTVYNLIWPTDTEEAKSSSVALAHDSYVLKGHSKAINSIAWSPYDDGKLATASDDCTVQVWNVETGAILNSYISTYYDPIRNVLWSPLRQDLIITTAKEMLEVWDLKEHGPKTKQEIDELLGALSKNKNKNLSNHIHSDKKDQLQAKIEEKSKKTVLLPTLAKAQNDVVQALSDCRQLLEKTKIENNSVMQFFGDKENVLKMLTNQQHNHMSRNKPELAQHLSLWKGDLLYTIKSAIENGTVTPWLICITPMVSPQLWQSACLSYAKRQSEESSDNDPIVTASFFLACHDVESAVNVLSEAKLFREAVAVIKTRLIEYTEIYNKMMTDVMEKWAMTSIITGMYEIAAQCFIYLEAYDEAAKALFKRADVNSLKLAMDLANIGNNEELKLAIKTRLDMFDEIPPSNYIGNEENLPATNKEEASKAPEVEDTSGSVILEAPKEGDVLEEAFATDESTMEKVSFDVSAVKELMDCIKIISEELASTSSEIKDLREQSNLLRDVQLSLKESRENDEMNQQDEI